MQLSRRLLVKGAAAAILAVVAAAGARGARAHSGSFHGAGMAFGGDSPLSHELLRAADLTPDQKTKLEVIRQSYADSRSSLFAELRGTQDPLRAKLLAPGSPSEADFAAVEASIAQLRQQMMQQGIKEALDVRSVLTADQLAKMSLQAQQLESLRRQMRAVMHGDTGDQTS